MFNLVCYVLLATVCLAENNEAQQQFRLSSKYIPAESRLSVEEEAVGEVDSAIVPCPLSKNVCPPPIGDNFGYIHGTDGAAWVCRRTSDPWYTNNNWLWTCPKGCTSVNAWPYCIDVDTRCIDSSNECGENDDIWLMENNQVFSRFCTLGKVSCNKCGGKFCYENVEQKETITQSDTKYFKLGYEFPCLGGDILSSDHGECPKGQVEDLQGCLGCSGASNWCDPCPSDFPHQLCNWGEQKKILVCMPCTEWYLQFNEICEAVQEDNNEWSAQPKLKYRGTWGATGFRDWIYAGESYIYPANVEVSHVDRITDVQLPSICELSTKHGSFDLPEWQQMTEFKEGDGVHAWGWDPNHNVKCRSDQQGHPSHNSHGNGCDKCTDVIHATTTTYVPTTTTTTSTTEAPTTTETTEFTTYIDTTIVDEAPSCVFVCLPEAVKCESFQAGVDPSTNTEELCPPSPYANAQYSFIPGFGNTGNQCVRPQFTLGSGVVKELVQSCPFYCDRIAQCTTSFPGQNHIHCSSSVLSSDPVCVFNTKIDGNLNTVAEAKEIASVKEVGSKYVKRTTWNNILIGLGWLNSLLFAYAIPYLRNKRAGDYVALASE